MLRNFVPLAVCFSAAFLISQSGCQNVGPAAPALTVPISAALGDGKAKATPAFQQALDQCGAQGGGIVEVPAGTFLIGSIELKSNTTLKLEKGAILQGSDDLDDYPVIQVRWEGQWVAGHRGLIYASHADHIAVTGPGQILASPHLAGRTMPRRPVLIEPMDCNHIELTGFSTHHSTMWSIHPVHCTYFAATDLTIRSSGGNGDGIDVDSCKHVAIEHCDIDTGDDCIALKAGRGLKAWQDADATSDVHIANCTLGDSIFACIGIGSENSGGIHDVSIEHCKFTHARSDAIYIKTNNGRGASLTNITANDLDVTTTGFLRINLTTSGIAGNDPVPGNDGIATASGFSFTNVKVNCRTLVDAYEISAVKPLSGLILTDITGTAARGIELANINGAVLKNISVTGVQGPLLAIYNVNGTGLDGAVPFKPRPPATRPTRNARSGAATRI